MAIRTKYNECNCLLKKKNISKKCNKKIDREKKTFLKILIKK